LPTDTGWPTAGEPEILRTPTIELCAICEFADNDVPERSLELPASELPKDPRIFESAREEETAFLTGDAFSQT